jgi:hypothetical protein
MITKRWKNAAGQGYSIELGIYTIRVITWFRNELTTIDLLGPPPKTKGYINILSGRVAFTENEIGRHIETAKDEIQAILNRA